MDAETSLKKLRKEFREEAETLRENIARGNVGLVDDYPYQYWVGQYKAYVFFLEELDRKIARLNTEFMEEDEAADYTDIE